MPNHLPRSRNDQTVSPRLLILVLAISGLSLAPTCGKRRPPLPPVERVPQRTELLSGVQRGNQVILSWPAPRRNAPDSSVQSIRRIDVYRVAVNPAATPAMTEEEFGARATLIGSATYAEIRKATDSLTYTDTLELAGKPARLVYAIRYVNAAGERAAFSNFLHIDPAAKIAEPPRNVKLEQLSEDTIAITWEPPTANIDGSTPVNLLGYNVYRVAASQTERGQTPVNQALINGTQYQDKNFKLGEKYEYVARAVSLGTEGGQVESLNSNSVEITPVDKYPPSAPGRPSIGPGPGRLSIFWPANPEGDIAGYYIYRATDPNLPTDQWAKLTPTLNTRTTFTDENVEVGKTYYYFVVAVDTAGNISAPSEVVSETVP